MCEPRASAQVHAQQQRLLAVERASRAHVSGISRRLEEKGMEFDSLQQRLSEHSQYAGMLRRLHLDESQRNAMLEAQVKNLLPECSRLDKRQASESSMHQASSPLLILTLCVDEPGLST